MNVDDFLKKEYFIIVLTSILIIVALIIIFTIYISQESQEQVLIVPEVIDGDTAKLVTGEYVRLLGINAPEKGQKFYEESKNRLKELIEGKFVRLERDIEDKDKYGRWLRYVYVDGEMVNIQLVREGYAKPYFFEEIKYKDEIEQAWNFCQQEKLNLCGLEERCDNSCIGLQYINWNAKGNDCHNLNDEYIVFKNYCNISCNLTNWRLFDMSNNSFYFPEFTLKPNSKVTIYSGKGENTDKKLYWDSKAKGCGAVWNNGCEGDIVCLENSKGILVFKYNYRGFC